MMIRRRHNLNCDHVFVEVDDSFAVINEVFDPRYVNVVCCKCGETAYEKRR